MNLVILKLQGVLNYYFLFSVAYSAIHPKKVKLCECLNEEMGKHLVKKIVQIRPPYGVLPWKSVLHMYFFRRHAAAVNIHEEPCFSMLATHNDLEFTKYALVVKLIYQNADSQVFDLFAFEQVFWIIYCRLKHFRGVNFNRFSAEKRHASLLGNGFFPAPQADQRVTRAIFMQDVAPPHIAQCLKDVHKKRFKEQRVIRLHFRHVENNRSSYLNSCDSWLLVNLKHLVSSDKSITLPDL